MSLKDKIYENSPIFMQHFFISLYGAKLRKERFGKEYYSYLDFIEKFEKLDIAEQETFQVNELKKLIKYAINNSKFYKDFYAGIDLESINSLDDIKQLPILTKDILRENIKDAITIPKNEAIEGHTGGTTGTSLVVYFTKADNQRRIAQLDYFKRKHGFINCKMRKATFNGKHIVPATQRSKIFWRYNSSIKQMIYSSFHITEENIPFYINSLNKFKPIAIDGFFSSIYEIANYMQRHNIKLEFKPIAIFPTSETITQCEKEIIETVFNSPVLNQYSSSEGAPYITECPSRNLHYDTASGIFEHFEEGSSETLVTSFSTYGTPLIRYRIGDSVEFSDGAVCSCGAKTPIIKNVNGRAADFLYASNGAKINLGNVSNIFKNIPNAIIKAQLIQEVKDRILVKIVVDDKIYKTKHEQIIKEEMRTKFGLDMKVDVIMVDDIERAKSGKYRLVINTVDITN